MDVLIESTRLLRLFSETAANIWHLHSDHHPPTHPKPHPSTYPKPHPSVQLNSCMWPRSCSQSTGYTGSSKLLLTHPEHYMVMEFVEWSVYKKCSCTYIFNAHIHRFVHVFSYMYFKLKKCLRKIANSRPSRKNKLKITKNIWKCHNIK